MTEASRPQTAITLLLPFQRYRLRFTHRLLDSLGGVSRFILRALADGREPEEIAEVTALPHTTLLQQMTFLAHHHLISVTPDAGAPIAVLLERGARMVAIERYLRQGDHRIWLDTFTVDRNAVHLLVAPHPDSLIRVPHGDFRPEVRLPARRHQYHLFDDANRLHRLLDRDKLADLIGHFWTGAQALISEEVDYLDCVLGQEAADGQEYFPLPLPANHLLDIASTTAAGKKTALPSLLIPVLGIAMKFGRAEGYPWPVRVPAARTSYVELVSQRLLPDFMPDGETDPSAPDIAVAPATSGERPSGLEDTVVPPGLSVACTTSRAYARRTIDHGALTRRMHESTDVFLISSNQSAQEADPDLQREPSCA